MHKTAFFLLTIAGFAAVTHGAAAIAADHATTFRDIQFGYSRDDQLNAARKIFSQELPVGIPLQNAQSVLHAAGARCKPAKDFLGLICHVSAFETVEDHLHDVYWTIRVTEQGGFLKSVSIDRESRGS